MARLITIYWRDIPSRLVARRGRESIRQNLPVRFQKALQRAALRAGKGSTEQYIEDWRREACEIEFADANTTLAEHVKQEFDKIDGAYDDERLEQLAKNQGREN